MSATSQGRIGVIPVDGRRVLKPDGQLLQPGGELVDPDPYWARRKRDGDVRFGTPRKPQKPKPVSVFPAANEVSS